MAKRGANARKQFISVKGLYDIVIRAKIKRRDFFRRFISRGQDDDSTVHRLDQGNELNTVTVGQAKIEQNKFTTRLTRTNQGVGGSARLFDPKPSLRLWPAPHRRSYHKHLLRCYGRWRSEGEAGQIVRHHQRPLIGLADRGLSRALRIAASPST